ncbi:AbrB/MazE/SpoVT family DNA-binding domain-containing protein [Nitrincola sp.]|uniref:AbrB/MazE/SpoVT family DNA-binding domain-containing protein n=1 Tax=Nitrincola sp. TaxID=1926584 RepID=UPI003A8FC9F8
METQIKRWGNSAAIRIPSKILADANLEVGSQINIVVKGNRIVIEPMAKASKHLKLPFTEQALLKGLDARTAHADNVAALLVTEWVE